MAEDKYQKDLERAEEITKRLEEKIKQKSRFDLAVQLSSRISLTPGSCRTLLIVFPNAYHISDSEDRDKNKKREQYQQTYLYRTAVVYELLEIKVDDPIIELTKQINPAFVYPPQPIPEKPYSCKITAKFSHKDLSLKPEQHKNLEKLALNYALQNRNPQ